MISFLQFSIEIHAETKKWNRKKLFQIGFSTAVWALMLLTFCGNRKRSGKELNFLAVQKI